jgi:hypothetical protein
MNALDVRPSGAPGNTGPRILVAEGRPPFWADRRAAAESNIAPGPATDGSAGPQARGAKREG